MTAFGHQTRICQHAALDTTAFSSNWIYFYQCAKLAELYMEWPIVRVYCVGLGNRPGFHKFHRFPLGLESTFNDFKSNQYDAAPLTTQTAHVMNASVVCLQVERLGCAARILSVDNG